MNFIPRWGTGKKHWELLESWVWNHYVRSKKKGPTIAPGTQVFVYHQGQFHINQGYTKDDQYYYVTIANPTSPISSRDFYDHPETVEIYIGRGFHMLSSFHACTSHTSYIIWWCQLVQWYRDHWLEQWIRYRLPIASSLVVDSKLRSPVNVK